LRSLAAGILGSLLSVYGLTWGAGVGMLRDLWR